MATVKDLVSFDGTNGKLPEGSLIADSQGNLYGTVANGSATGAGAVFELVRTGTGPDGAPIYATSPTILVSFTGGRGPGSNGGIPAGSLFKDAVGNLYGTTSFNGPGGYGTVFEIARTGSDGTGAPTYASSPTTLVSFSGNGNAPNTIGGQPVGDLIADGQGNLYGTTENSGPSGYGTVFEIARTGTTEDGAPTYATSPTTLVSFDGTISETNGGNPLGSLIFDSSGNLYGTTVFGGPNGFGTVFEITRTGMTETGAPTYATSPTTLVAFSGFVSGNNGASPYGSLLADGQGNLYGTTQTGGAFGNGTVFEITRTGSDASGSPVYATAPTTLVSFQDTGGAYSGHPEGSLIADAAGNLYGTTRQGGANGGGDVFKIARTGSDASGAPIYATTPTTLASFDGDGLGYGESPVASLYADTQGNLYGTTSQGGAKGAGTVFEVVDSGFVVCFAAGTAIRTTSGDMVVEHLAVGDRVVTTSGAHRPIRWLGHRAVDCRRHPRPHEVMPVRIAAHAFGENRPARDLRVSPGHAICVDVLGEILIPAASLINGATIVQEPVDTVTYWHVELDSHDVILAENLPCESYLEMGNRSFFAGGGVVALDASPDARAVTHADFCRPFHADGALVAFVRERLALRARDRGWFLEDQGLGDLHLIVDGVRIDPQVRGLAVRFTMPAAARDVWLVSSTSSPAAISASPDTRLLGVCLQTLAIDDGFGAPQAIAVDDPCLCVGLHDVEHEGDGKRRWTAGRARLPASFWEERRGMFFLRLDLALPALPRWVAPVPVVADAPGGSRLVA